MSEGRAKDQKAGFEAKLNIFSGDNSVQLKEKLFSHTIIIGNELLTIFVRKIPSEVNINHNDKKLNHD